jgi:hypothetical protein
MKTGGGWIQAARLHRVRLAPRLACEVYSANVILSWWQMARRFQEEQRVEGAT